MSSFMQSIAVTLAVPENIGIAGLKSEPKKATERFVRGPIPAEWLEQAARLPGKALHVAVAIQYLNGFQRTGTVDLQPKVRNAYGMDPFACGRALEQLEVAGLVTVLRKPGAAPVVTILAANTQQNDSSRPVR